MKTYLLFAERDLPQSPQPVWNGRDLIEDLGLAPVIAAMGSGDDFVAQVAQRVLLEPLMEIDEIAYRQGVLQDCMDHEPVVRQLYEMAGDALVQKRHVFGWASTPASVLHHAIQVMQVFIPFLRRLHDVSRQGVGEFGSAGFQRFFQMCLSELDDEFFAEVETHLELLTLSGGLRIGARLGTGGKYTGFVLDRPRHERLSLAKRLNALTHPPLSFRIADRDQAGCNALSALQGQGINLVADALARSADHVDSFFAMLRTELAFYVGCLNLKNALESRGCPVTFPVPLPGTAPELDADGMVDVGLTLVSRSPVIGNDVHPGGRPLILVTGANRGGKSTFLRSVGLAQLMTQSGLFVAAQNLRTSLVSGLFTHFKREEDDTMASGKFDEELGRMAGIVDHLHPSGMVLFNESFAATNEREGSQIGRQIVHALLDRGVRVVFVTHHYSLADGLAGESSCYCLRAGRERSFRLIEGPPEPTSYGADLYAQVFGAPLGVPVGSRPPGPT